MSDNDLDIRMTLDMGSFVYKPGEDETIFCLDWEGHVSYWNPDELKWELIYRRWKWPEDLGEYLCSMSDTE